MKNVLIILLFLFIVGGIVAYVYLNNLRGRADYTQTSNIVNSSLCIPAQGGADTSKQLNQTNDTQRKDNINIIRSALEIYYQQNKKAPKSLNDLVVANLIAEVPLDPVSKKPPTYIPDDATYGCIVESPLCNGPSVTATCK